MSTPRPAPPRQSFPGFLAAGFGRRSALVLGLVFATYVAVGLRFPFLIDPRLEPDWLLFGIWTYMTVAMTWDVAPRRDLQLVVVGLVGGLVIEWWGTNTQLWRYYTHERPPMWILPAWPIAALSIHRLATVIGRLLPFLRRLGAAYWVVVPAFVLAMTRFLWPSIDQPASWVVLAIMLVIAVVQPRPDRDLVLFVAGVSLGLFLEYWGTSRRCWIYYTKEVPPVEAVLAHGFAAISFARGVQLLDAVQGSVFRRDLSVPAGG